LQKQPPRGRLAAERGEPLAREARLQTDEIEFFADAVPDAERQRGTAGKHETRERRLGAQVVPDLFSGGRQRGRIHFRCGGGCVRPAGGGGGVWGWGWGGISPPRPATP